MAGDLFGTHGSHPSYHHFQPSGQIDEALYSPLATSSTVVGGPSPSYSAGGGSNPTASPATTVVEAVATPSQASVVSPGKPEPPEPKRRKSGPGRPATARRIWQQPIMQRRLVRLYLYSDESTLKTKQISQLLSALARLEGSSKVYV